jgi:RHS repeat-associated protein
MALRPREIKNLLPFQGWRLQAARLVNVVTMMAVLVTGVPHHVNAAPPEEVFYYYLPDQLGTTAALVDRDGMVVQRYGHTTFGKQHYQMSTAAFPVSNRFTGQQKDDDTGLCYYGARYYDPELGRFVQADSIVPDEMDTQAHDRYAYVRNNPLNLVDPSGENNETHSK